MRTLLLLAAFVLLPTTVSAQRQDQGAWFAFASTGRFEQAYDGKLRWWFDGHARFFNDSDGFDTSIVRPGIGYDLGGDFTAWMGYAWIRNDPPGGAIDEQRIWQQLTWGRPYDWGTPLLRTRLEQRFDERRSDTGWRLRQFARWTKPVSPESRLGYRVWDEVFYDLNNTNWGQDSGFRQNRAFAGFGWTLDEQLTLEFGYLNQYLWRDGRGDSSNHVLAVTLFGSF